MRSFQVSSIVIAAALSACAHEPEALNSERIEQQFGSYGIEVLSQEAGIRRSNLYSVHGGDHVCRTYAVVRFADDLAPEVADAHADVIAGQSIGSTFRSDGWHIKKNTIYVGTLPMTDIEHPIARLMRLQQQTELGVHAYRFVLQREELSINYATIVETHHPDYLSTDELQTLYGESNRTVLSSEEIENLSTLITDID